MADQRNSIGDRAAPPGAPERSFAHAARLIHKATTAEPYYATWSPHHADVSDFWTIGGISDWRPLRPQHFTPETIEALLIEWASFIAGSNRLGVSTWNRTRDTDDPQDEIRIYPVALLRDEKKAVALGVYYDQRYVGHPLHGLKDAVGAAASTFRRDIPDERKLAVLNDLVLLEEGP